MYLCVTYYHTKNSNIVPRVSHLTAETLETKLEEFLVL